MFGMMQFKSPENKPSPDDLMEEDFRKYATALGATADQIESAYLHLCKVDESEMTDPAVWNLHQEMDRLVRHRFPINRFVDLIQKQRGVDINRKLGGDKK